MDNIVTYKVDLSSHPALAEVLDVIVDKCTRAGAAACVVSFADCPFLNDALTAELIERHFKYSAEYTFADGYPGGLAPEVIDAGAAKILLEMVQRTRHCEPEGRSNLASGRTSSEGEIASGARKRAEIAMTADDGGGQPMTRTGIWDLIQTDVNAFQIETVIAPHDYRPWRLDFHTGDKRGAISCHALLNALPDGTSPWDIDADELSQIAIRRISVVRTVPAFYQVETRTTQTAMPLDKFAALVQQMKMLSDDAVVSIDTADPAYVEVLAKAGLDILIEIGEVPSEDIIARCHDIDPNIRWIVECTSSYMDYVAGATGDDEMAHTVEVLSRHFPGRVYPQLVRTTETEPQLEAFWRKWSAPDSPSGGKVLITKYCSYCGTLPDLKPADLAPLERNPCWHLRRDMVVLADGTVPLCFARVPLVANSRSLSVSERSEEMYRNDNILGNVFTDGLAALWEKMTPFAERDLQYCLATQPVVECFSRSEKCIETTPIDDLCRKCDEYYTFNF